MFRRRDFLAYGAGSIAALSLARPFGMAQEGLPGIDLTIRLAAEEIYEEMIDGEVIFALAYRNLDTGELRPVLNVSEFDRVTVQLENRTSRFVGFRVTGVPESGVGAIAPGTTGGTAFVAPEGGTYIFFDPINAPVHRVMGLHGAFIASPDDGNTPNGVPLPYSFARQTPAAQLCFEALGEIARFEGRRWDPGDIDRQRVWVFNTVDTRFNRRMEMGLDIDPAEFVATNLPDYFTLNGLSGYDAAHDERTVPRGYIGQPMLIRSVNVGLATHAPHIHGNHTFLLSDRRPEDDGIFLNTTITEIDTWMLRPMDRKDVLLPFEVPPDIPPAAWPPREEPFPLRYPMHCHMEMSQTARGGNYPQGLVTDWEILGTFATLEDLEAEEDEDDDDDDDEEEVS